MIGAILVVIAVVGLKTFSKSDTNSSPNILNSLANSDPVFEDQKSHPAYTDRAQSSFSVNQMLPEFPTRVRSDFQPAPKRMAELDKRREVTELPKIGETSQIIELPMVSESQSDEQEVEFNAPNEIQLTGGSDTQTLRTTVTEQELNDINAANLNSVLVDEEVAPGLEPDDFDRAIAEMVESNEGPATPNELEAPADTFEVVQDNQEFMTPVQQPVDVDLFSLQIPRGISQQVQTRLKYGSSLARRGAFASAEEELLKGVRLISESLDSQSGTRNFSIHFRNAMTAMKEAVDFMPSGNVRNTRTDITPIVQTHQTRILSDQDATQISSLAAMQMYYEYAQLELTNACGGQVDASQLLHALGKLYSTSGDQDGIESTMAVAKSMIMHQTALETDPNNHKSANELGVAMARYGRMEEAKSLILHSLSIKPEVVTWKNLAAIHKSLGESNLEKLAVKEIGILASKTELLGRNPQESGAIVWVNPNDFDSRGASPQLPSQPKNPAPAKVAKKTTVKKSTRSRIAEKLDQLKFWK